MRTRVYISFDYDHDLDLKNALMAHSENPDSPFSIADWSIKEPSATWKQDARERIKRSTVVAVICGAHTDTATGVNEEIRIAREEGRDYFLLWGRKDGTVKKPTAARSSDKIYKWTWPNLKSLVGGAR